MDFQGVKENIRSRVSIVSYIGEKVPLKKSGRHFKGVCPFHQEKTPSFMVSDEKQIFHCFGCGEGGDIFSFLMKFENLTFPEALRELADRAGVELPSQTRQQRSEEEALLKRKEWAYRLNEIAAGFFQQQLKQYPEGQEYLKSRGLTHETIEQFKIGYAPNGWNGLVDHLRHANVPLKMGAEIGVVKEKTNGEFFDFFRHRIIFPIQNAKGKNIGFGGRALAKEEEAKYLNSSDSFIYHKSFEVFGLPQALETIRQNNEIILVEGYMDLIILHQAGIKNTVAPLGTAITPDHLRHLSRYTKNFVLAMDGDTAGRQAAFRSLPAFLELKLTPKGMMLPESQDPDDFVRKNGANAFLNLKNESLTLMEAAIDDTVDKSEKGTQGRLAAWKKLEPLLNQVQDNLEKAIYLKRVEKKLQFDENQLKLQKKTTLIPPKVRSKYSEEERLLLAALVVKPSKARAVLKRESICQNSLFNEVCKQLFLEETDEGVGSLEGKLKEHDPELARLVRELVMIEEGEGFWERVINDCIRKIETRLMDQKLTELNTKITEAEKEADEETLMKLLMEKSKLIEVRKGLNYAS